MLPLAIASGLLGAYQFFEAQRGLNKMGDKPVSQVSPELQRSYDEARYRTRFGFLPAQEAAFQNKYARSQNTGYQRSLDQAGTNLAGAIGAGQQYTNVGAQLGHAAEDAALQDKRFAYADQRLAPITAQQNLIVGQKRGDYDLKARAFGAAMKAGLNNVVGMANLNQAVKYAPGANPGAVNGLIEGSTSASAKNFPPNNIMDLTKNLGFGNNDVRNWRMQNYSPDGSPIQPDNTDPNIPYAQPGNENPYPESPDTQGFYDTKMARFGFGIPGFGGYK